MKNSSKFIIHKRHCTLMNYRIYELVLTKTNPRVQILNSHNIEVFAYPSHLPRMHPHNSSYNPIKELNYILKIHTDQSLIYPLGSDMRALSSTHLDMSISPGRKQFILLFLFFFFVARQFSFLSCLQLRYIIFFCCFFSLKEKHTHTHTPERNCTINGR